MSDKARLVVLVSGTGTNLQAILDACASGELDAEVAAVVSNKAGAYGLQRAAKAGVPGHVLLWTPYKEKDASRAAYDAALAELLGGYEPDFVVLAGWMRLLSMAFLDKFPMRVVNLHPALPGTFPGVDAIERAYRAFGAGKITETGVMVHYVPDEGVDQGPVIAQQRVPIYAEDSLDDLAERMHETEHDLLIDSLKMICGQEEIYE